MSGQTVKKDKRDAAQIKDCRGETRDKVGEVNISQK